MAITSGHVSDGVEALDYAERNWYLFAVSGAVSAVIGILVLVYPDPSVKLLGVFIGIDLLIVGVLLIVRGAASRSDPSAGPAEILLGTLALIAGLIVIRNPGDSLVLLAVAFAAYLIVAGSLALAAALVNREGRGTALARGLVLVAAGAVIIAWPDISVKTLTVLAGIALILQGAAEIAEALLLRGLRRAGAST
jgi:uncharacterized membrane protein HdeD (DUF308 family)